MNINFVLPYIMDKPFGGFRVAYEYGNQLAKRGHTVKFYYPVVELNGEVVKNCDLNKVLMLARNRFPLRIQPDWFTTWPSIEHLLIPEINDLHMPDSDVVIATAFTTANMIRSLQASKGKKVYLIQHNEAIMAPPEFRSLVKKTWDYDFYNVTVSGWLADELTANGSKVTAHISNGIDMTYLKLSKAIEKREAGICMMLSIQEWKGPLEGVNAYIELKKSYGYVKFSMFGTVDRPAGLPDFIQYYKSPSREELNQILNEHSIFISPSWIEGFGLPGAEAMVCGCALVTTDNKGCRDYAVPGKTALVVPPRNYQALVKAASLLLDNDAARINLAAEGNEFIQCFTWENAADKFEQLLKKITGLSNI